MPRKSSKTYADKLRDPRWQKLRLEVLSRDKFTCRCCGDDKSELQVNHLVYLGSDPWDADVDFLETLCKKCHERRTAINKGLIADIKSMDTASLIVIEDALHASKMLAYEGICESSIARLIACAHNFLVDLGNHRRGK